MSSSGSNFPQIHLLTLRFSNWAWCSFWQVVDIMMWRLTIKGYRYHFYLLTLLFQAFSKLLKLDSSPVSNLDYPCCLFSRKGLGVVTQALRFIQFSTEIPASIDRPLRMPAPVLIGTILIRPQAHLCANLLHCFLYIDYPALSLPSGALFGSLWSINSSFARVAARCHAWKRAAAHSRSWVPGAACPAPGSGLAACSAPLWKCFHRIPLSFTWEQ